MADPGWVHPLPGQDIDPHGMFFFKKKQNTNYGL